MFLHVLNFCFNIFSVSFVCPIVAISPLLYYYIYRLFRFSFHISIDHRLLEKESSSIFSAFFLSSLTSFFFLAIHLFMHDNEKVSQVELMSFIGLQLTPKKCLQRKKCKVTSWNQFIAIGSLFKNASLRVIKRNNAFLLTYVVLMIFLLWLIIS